MNKATWLGCLAILLWAIEPLLVSEMDGIPLFQMLTIVFASSFLVTAVKLTVTRRWSTVLNQPLFLWCSGILCICGSDFAYVLGANCAPIAHVDLIDYLWPCFVILFGSMLPKEKFYAHQVVGGVIGVLGILVLLVGDLQGISTSYMLGYLLALKGALIWGGYAAISRYYSKAPIEMVGMYGGVGALICYMFHLTLEQTIIPSASQLGLSVAFGATGAGVAYQLWDHGVKHGNFKLLGSLTYLARIFAMVLLVIWGKEPFSWALVVAVILASFGTFLTSVEKISFRKKQIKSVISL